MKLKSFLRKALSFLKSYWYIPAILVAVIVSFIIWRKVPKSLSDMLAKRVEMHAREVEIIDKVHAEEIEQRDKALEIYHETIYAIEEKYKEDKLILSGKKKKEIKSIVNETRGSPELITKKLADQMGFEIVYTKNSKDEQKQ